MVRVRLDRATVVTDRVRRLDGVSLDVPDGAFVGVVGPSGAGKSSLLRAIAGLDRLTTGAIHFGADDVTHMAPAQRDVGVVFQEPALLPNRTVRGNVSFPLDIRKRDPEEIRQRVDAEVRALGIEGLLKRHPDELSHGEQQMVQIARTLVRTPRVLLLDEPFASLDEPLRQRMRAEIAMLQDGYGVTTIMTTNDPADLALVGAVAVVHEGLLVQYGPTREVRRHPATMVAAAVTGWVSLIEMTVVADGRGVWLMRENPDGGELVRVRSWSPELLSRAGRRVVVGVRPEDLVVSEHGTIPAVVEQSIPVPAASLRCRVAGVRVTAGADRHRRFAPGDVVRLRLDHFTVFDPVTEIAIGV